MHETTAELIRLEDIPEELRFSPSKLKAYHGCEQRATYNYLEDMKMPEGESSEALTRGKIAHLYLENWHKDHKHPNETFKMLWPQYTTPLDKNLVTWNLTMMGRYIARYGVEDLKRYRFVALEQRYHAKLTTPKGREVYIDGIIDAIVEDLITKQFGPWDHKTSGFNLWTRKAVVFDMQLNLYCVLLYLLGYTVNFATINQIYTGIKKIENLANTPQDKLFSRHTIEITPNTLDYWLETIGRKIDKIIDNYPNPKDLNQTANCPHCPYYGACELVLLRKDPTHYIDTVLRPAIHNWDKETPVLDPEDAFS